MLVFSPPWVQAATVFSTTSYRALVVKHLHKGNGAQRTTRGLCAGRTIAGLEGADLIDTPHTAKALQYRKREGEQVARGVTLRGETSMLSSGLRLRMSIMSSSESIPGDAVVEVLPLRGLDREPPRSFNMCARGPCRNMERCMMMRRRFALDHMRSAQSSYLCQ